MSFISRILGAFYRTFLEVDDSRRIVFGEGFYFQIPRFRVELNVSATELSGNAEISLAETRQIFASIKSAYELQNIQRVKAGDLICTTDCRVDPQHPDRVTIKFEGSLSANAYLHRATVRAALGQYEKKFRRLVD
jgi:hypothetical protein